MIADEPTICPLGEKPMPIHPPVATGTLDTAIVMVDATLSVFQHNSNCCANADEHCANAVVTPPMVKLLPVLDAEVAVEVDALPPVAEPEADEAEAVDEPPPVVDAAVAARNITDT